MKTTIVRLGGGLDTETSPMSMDPGALIGVENYEPRGEGGYERTKGLEAYDGHPKPSAALFVVLGATWTAGATVGSTLVGATSAATGVIAYVSSTLLAVTKVTGTFVAGENVTVSAVVVGAAITYEPTTTAAQDNAMYAAAAAIYRADIDEVPGEGPVCGVCVVDDVVYAFRNNVGSTKQEVWKASAAGWVAIQYPNAHIVGFSVGNGPYLNGNGIVTLTQGANTVSVHRAMVRTGSFDGGDAVGVLLLRQQASPGALTSGAATLSDGTTLELQTGTSVLYQPVALLPSGRWSFKPYRFSFLGLLASPTPVYGVDWTNDGAGGGNFIEFDGTIVCPIFFGNPLGVVYAVERLECHKDSAFLALRGSLFFSSIGDPYQYDTLTGAGEIVIGDQVTEMMSIQGSEDQGALLVCCANKASVIYGNDSADWNMVPLSRQVGAKPYSMQQIAGATVAMDDQGVRDFRPTATFGNFAFNTLTNHIRKKVTGKTPTASVIDRAGGRYRLYFDDGTWISGVPGKRWSWTICRYPFTVSNAGEFEIAGVSQIFLCGEDGHVYQADVGRNFDGDAIAAWLKTAYAHLGAPTERKAFRMMTIEVRSETVGTISVQPDYSYGDTAIDETAMAAYENAALAGSDAAFDLGNWDVGTWDAHYLNELRVRAPGVGENVSVLLHSEADDELTHELTAITHYHMDRRQKR